MKRFTIMLPEDVIAIVKRAKYSPSKKRKIIEALLKDTFFQLEGLEYPNTIELGVHASIWDKKHNHFNDGKH